MAEITITLLTPISLRLSWEGSGDFEVWWKSDHPAGQEFAPLATVTGTSYDVGNLSWSTNYYFKVRQVGGAFGEVVTVFVCCGQAIVSGPGLPPGGPPAITTLNYWQQSADQDNLDVGFMGKTVSDVHSYLYLYKGGEWYFLGHHSYQTHFQSGVRKVGVKIAAFDMWSFYGFEAGWYVLTFWDGYSFHVTPLPLAASGEDGSFWPSMRTAQFAITMNENGRIVVAPCYIDWSREDGPGDIYGSPGDWWPNVFSYFISYDWGNTWSAETIITESISREQGMCIAECGNGDILFTMTSYDPLLYPTYASELIGVYGPPVRVNVIYYIYRWGTLIKTINTDLQNVYGPPPNYQTLDPKMYLASCNIATEGGKVALAYAYDHTLIAYVGGNFWGTPRYFVDTSNDNGATWNGPQEILFSDSLLSASNWRTTLPPICISNGNLFVYVVGGTYSARKYYILKSTNNGASWTIAYDIPVTNANYYWDAEIRANGDHITMCACGMSMDSGQKLGFAESLDGGATWHIVSIEPAPTIQIQAPE